MEKLNNEISNLQERTNQVAQGKEELRLSEANLQERTNQVEQGNEYMRLSEANLQKVIERAKQSKESLHLSELALQEVIEQAKLGKESLRFSELALQKVIEQVENSKLLNTSVLQEATKLALTDPLTQLPNRTLFNDRLEQAIFWSNRNGFYSALLFLDLNNFKPLNDTHGHKYGDLVLIEVAHRLTNCLRDIDTIARIGGDEFTVILNNLDINEDNSILKAYNIAEKIRSAILLPYILGIESNIEHCCTISIGIVLFKNEETSSVNIIDLADKAMYKAKSIGGNSIRFINHSGDFYNR